MLVLRNSCTNMYVFSLGQPFQQLLHVHRSANPASFEFLVTSKGFHMVISVDSVDSVDRHSI